MKRVPDWELDYPGEDGRYYHEGVPFTGIAFRMAAEGQLVGEVE